MRPWILGGLFLLAGAFAFRLAARYVERRIVTRIEAAAARIGARVTFDQLRVGLFPPVRMTGIVIDKPGQWAARIESLSISPWLLGPRGFSLIGRVHMGAWHLTLPADLELRLYPSAWDVDPGRSLTLRSPVEGLTLTSTSGPGGRVFDVRASQVPIDRLAAFELEDSSSRLLGILDGEAHVEGEPRLGLQARWRFEAIGARTTGKVIVTPAPKEARLEVSATIEDLDFTRLFRAVGLQLPDSGDTLGSLSGTVRASGLLYDPATLAVIQQFDFTPPQRKPPSITRLRSAFVHEIAGIKGARKRIDVSPSSPDFVALSDVPPLFIRALLIAEDAAFFSHPGLDLTELPRALATNWARGEAVRGASTITQQLAKNLFLTREKSLHRKLKELSFSFLLESTLGKQRILEIYLNIIEWGPGLYGLRPAARHYFDKEPQALTPREIAFLVTLIPGPVKYQGSFKGGEMKRGFETLVLNLLVKLRSVDALSEEEYQDALADTLVFRGPPPEIDGTEGGRERSVNPVKDADLLGEPAAPASDHDSKDQGGDDDQNKGRFSRHG